MNLSQVFQDLKQQDKVQLDPAWGQGRATWGGIVGSLLFAKLEAILDQPRRLRSFTVSFVGPVDSSGEVEVKAQILRVGKSVLQGEVHLWQNGAVQAVLLASYGQARDSIVSVPAARTAPSWPAPEQLPKLPHDLPNLPNYLRELDIHWAHGDLPYSKPDDGEARGEFGGYMRFAKQTGDFQLAHLVALIDAWPPAVTPLVSDIVPASSLTWTVECLQMPENASLADYWQYDVSTDFATEGYGYTEAKVWDKQGRLIAISRQTVTIFA